MIPYLLQAAGETREQNFEWGSMPPRWLAVVCVLLVVAFTASIYRRERPAGRGGARWGLGALRVAILLGVLAMLARPLVREIVYQTREPQFILLVDDSLSMKIQDKYADRSIPQRIGEMFRSSPENVERLSRYELVGRLLRNRDVAFLDSLRERGKVALLSFSGGLKKLRDFARRAEGEALAEGEEGEVLPDFSKIQSDERVKQTRMGDCLSEAASSSRGGFSGREEKDLAAVIVLSDGGHNSGALQPEDVARKLGQRGIPVHTVGVGNPEPPKDVRLLALDSSDVLLVGDRVPFEATVVADGFEGERVRVDLVFDGETVDTEYVTLEGRGERQLVRLDHIPRAPGDFTVAVKVEPSPGELFEENNSYPKEVKVLDQRIKVLYLEGPPRWEYRFLKNALIRDPTMEAQVFLYSADPRFIQESSPGIPPLSKDRGQGALVPYNFPETREALFQYHVVIIGDVDPDNLTQAEMDLLKEFVSEAGGGVVFIAGENANPSRYLHTALYPLLPVEVPEAGRMIEARSPTDRFNVELTGVGREHQVMRLDNDLERNRELWENTDSIDDRHLPGFYWYAEVNREKPGAVKLAVHPRQEHPVYGPRTIFAIQNLGKGRVFFSGVDNTWRWRAGVDNLYFYKFWAQVIRFASTGRLLGKTQRHSITTDKVEYTIGDPIAIDARVYDANMKPATEETLKIYHQVEVGGEAPRAPEAIVLSLNKVKGLGSYEGTIAAETLGRHELWIGTESERLAVRPFSVRVPDLEYRDTRMDRERLKRIAEVSGGMYHDFAEVGSLVKTLGGMTKPRQTPIDDRQEDLWDDFWILLAITGLLAGEWTYRKMVKLL